MQEAKDETTTHVVRVDDKTTTAITITEYWDTASALSLLQQRHKNVVYDVATTKGMEEAKKSRFELVKLRTALEKKRTELKAPILERGKALDDEAKALKAAIEALEKPIDAQITLEEERKKTERETKARLEQERQRGLRSRVTAVTQLPMKAIGKPSSEIGKILEELATAEFEAWAEFDTEAKECIAVARAQLDALYTAAVDAEAAAAEKAERDAELKRLEDERVEQQRIDDARVTAIRSIERMPAARTRDNVRDLRLTIDYLQAHPPTEERFGRRLQEALNAQVATLAALEDLLKARKEADERAEQQRQADLKRQQEETQRQAAENAERQRLKDEEDARRREQEAREAAERAEREAADAKALALLTNMQQRAPELLDALETMVDLVGKLVHRLAHLLPADKTALHDSEIAEVKHATLLVKLARGQE